MNFLTFDSFAARFSLKFESQFRYFNVFLKASFGGGPLVAVAPFWIHFWDLWAHVWEVLDAFWEALGAFWKLPYHLARSGTLP